MHKNNFDFLRLIFALSVIVTHSYPLTGVSEWDHDWLAGMTHKQATFSFIGVRGFFIISGFLIYQSLMRSRNLIEYFWKRVLRLYPALIVVLLLTCILAYFPFNGDLHSYLQNKSVSTYFTNNIKLFPVQYSIDGVFTDDAVHAINGSLWTIPYEFSFYVLLGVLWFFRRRGIKYFLVFGLVFLFTAFFGRVPQTWKFLYLDAQYVYELGIFFLGGALLAALNIEQYRNKKIMFFTGLTLFMLSIKMYNFYIFQFFSLPLMIVPFGLASTIYLRDIGARIGDMSYGIYIYGYPVQQTLRHYFKLDPVPLMISSLILVPICGYISWHLIEKRALAFKRLPFPFSLPGRNNNKNGDMEGDKYGAVLIDRN